jgi:hypothetical protein
MQEVDYKRFMLCLGKLAEVYHEDVTENKSAIYYDILKEYSIEDIERGVMEILRTRTTASYPKPAEIIQAFQGMAKDNINIAILAVKKAMLEAGAYASVNFSPSINATIESMGGWDKLCREWDEWKEKEFARIYETFLKRPPDDAPSFLPGIIALENSDKFPDHIPDLLQIDVDKRKIIDPGSEPKQIQKGE